MRQLNRYIIAGFAACLCAGAANAQNVRIYDTVKEKLARGEQVFGGTITTADFQAPSEATFIRMGVERALAAPASGTAPIEGAER